MLSSVNGRDIILTGVTGYIGSHFAAALTAKTKTVHVIGRPGLDKGSLVNVRPLHGATGIVVVKHDGSSKSIADAVSKLNDPILVHMAGLFVSSHRPEDVAQLIESNVGFSATLYEALKLTGATAVVNVGTLWEHESDGTYAPANLYASTKFAAQKVLDYYVQVHGFRAFTLKLLDTYGRDDTRQKLMPMLRRAALEQYDLDMSSGYQQISLTHIDDICRSLWACVSHVSNGGAAHAMVSALSDERHSVREIVAKIEEVTGTKLRINWGARKDDVRKQRVPWLGLRPVDGWQPQVCLQEGLHGYLNEAEPPMKEVFDAI